MKLNLMPLMKDYPIKKDPSFKLSKNGDLKQLLLKVLLFIKLLLISDYSILLKNNLNHLKNSNNSMVGDMLDLNLLAI